MYCVCFNMYIRSTLLGRHNITRKAVASKKGNALPSCDSLLGQPCAISGYLRLTASKQFSLPVLTFQPTGNLCPSHSYLTCSPFIPRPAIVVQDESFNNLGQDVSSAFIVIWAKLIRITEMNTLPLLQNNNSQISRLSTPGNRT